MNMDFVSEFASATLPWVAVAIALATAMAYSGKDKKKNSSDDE